MPRAAFATVVQGLPGVTKRFWVLVTLTGASAGLAAAGLLKGLEIIQRVAWQAGGGSFLDAVTAASPVRRVLLPLSAGVMVAVVSLLARRPLRGHGTAAIIESIWTRSGRMPFFWTLLRGVVSISAVGLGAPLGREGALLQAGSATGSAMATGLKIPPDQARLLVACGASAGLAAAYNVPIGAALFGLEVLLGSFALELLAPVVLSCVLGTLVSRLLIGNNPAYLIPRYELLGTSDVILAVAMAPLLGVASALFVRAINGIGARLEAVSDRVARFLPLASMAGVGLLAVAFPQLLGNGFDSVNLALLGNMPLLLLLVLPALKLTVTSTCAASGVPGGLFTPSLFYGAMIGGFVGQAANRFWPGLAPPGAFALLGMGAVLAGTTHAPVTAVLIIFELTADYGVILPLMLTAVISVAVSKRLEPDSLYTAPLRRRHVALPEASVPGWLRAQSVRAYVAPSAPTIGQAATFQEVMVRMLELPAGFDLYVVGEDQRLLGVVTLDDVKGHIPDYGLLSMLIAADAMRPVKPATTEMSLSEVAHLFGETSLERLPVVDRQGRVLGTIAKGDVLRKGRF